MQGELIREARGRITGRRVLPFQAGAPTLETSFEEGGTLLGAEVREMGTYTGTLRPDGTIWGEGQGVVMGMRGEVATWTGQGIGRVNQDGTISFRGAIYFQTQSPAWQRLNAVAGIFEYQQNADDTTQAKVWEWK